jgi:hypothetical protein
MENNNKQLDPAKIRVGHDAKIGCVVLDLGNGIDPIAFGLIQALQICAMMTHNASILIMKLQQEEQKARVEQEIQKIIVPAFDKDAK